MGRNRKNDVWHFDGIDYDDRLIYGRCCRTTGKGRGYAGIRSNRNYNVRDGLVCEGGGSSFYTGTICNDSWRR